MTPQASSALTDIANGLRTSMESTHRTREQALHISREVIQNSSRAIRELHRKEFEPADAHISNANILVTKLRDALQKHPELSYAGYVHDCQKEYVEAECMRAIIHENPLPSPKSLGVEPPAWLHGIAEAASESRRHLLDLLREGDLERGERVLHTMDTIFDTVISFDFPDPVTCGLRRATDSLRAVLERTRADLTLTQTQIRLERALLKKEEKHK